MKASSSSDPVWLGQWDVTDTDAILSEVTDLIHTPLGITDIVSS